MKLEPVLRSDVFLSFTSITEMSGFARKSRTKIPFVALSLSRLSLALLSLRTFRRWKLRLITPHFDYLYMSVFKNRMNK